MLLRLHHYYHFPHSSKPLDSTSSLQKPQTHKPFNITIRSCSTGRGITIDTKAVVGKTAIQRIAEKLRNLGYVQDDKANDNITEQTSPIQSGQGSAGEIFLPLPEQLQSRRVGYTLDSSWSTPYNPVPIPGSGTAITRYNELRSEAEKEKKRRQRGRWSEQERPVEKEAKVPTLAELTIPATELRRLRSVGISLKKKVNVGKAGITEGIINGIHERWRRSEVVKIKCEDLCRWNMKRTHDLLERKSGGLVVWRSGSIIILYRGINYKYPYFLVDGNVTSSASSEQLSSESSTDYAVDNAKDSSLECVNGVNATFSSPLNGIVDPSLLCGVGSDAKDCNLDGEDVVNSALPSPVDGMAHSSLVCGVGSPNKVRFQMPGETQLVEEADQLLDGLGPRFTDWWGDDPLPVDADLLPAIIPGFRKPFRLLPYGIRPKLTNDEMTTLKRLSRHLPYQFALGRNRNLQGLAASMIKLWEKCEIAKIAVKRGIQNMNSKMMAEELKLLTGGTLIARAGEFIVFYRGKDFLPPAVSTAMDERRMNRMHIGNETFISQSSKRVTFPEHEPEADSSVDQVVHEPEADSSVNQVVQVNDNQRRKIELKERKLRSTSKTVVCISSRLSMALEKKEKAEKLLAELEKSVEASKPEVDREGITKEERYMLRRVGLRMKPYLPMGRRGVFDGTIENMHLHWKYRELVKIISKDRCIEDAHGTARTLEAESGGILVAVERARKGYAIIIYRGKNYMRPVDLRPRTLLNKKQALKRSLEAQRSESLKLHILKLGKNIERLKHQMVKDAMEMNLQSTECLGPDTESESNDGTTSVCYAHQQTNADSAESVNDQKTTKGHASGLTSLSLNPCMGAISNEVIQLDERRGAYAQSDQDAERQQECSSEPVLDRKLSTTSREEGTLMDASTSKENLKHEKMRDLFQSELKSLCEQIPEETHTSTFPGEVENEAHNSANKLTESSIKFGKDDIKASLHGDGISNGSNVKAPSRSVSLSNRDRLLLRKQALKMKKRPVLAVGKSNLITGIAKAINVHFEKHPLAIVNVKGRAKGTSIQELVFKLEQATGSVLVSQEPNKVILYKDLGDAKEPRIAKKKGNARGISKKKGNARGRSAERDDSEDKTPEMLSPQLIEAIRLECGLESTQDKETAL